MFKSFKIVLIGHFGVGKSSLIRQYVENQFSDQYKITIGVHIFKKDIELNQEKFTFIIWDIEGKDDLLQIRKSHLLGSAGFIFVFDPTRPSTFENINEETAFFENEYPNTQWLLVANKLDLIEKDAFIAQHNLTPDIFASAKTNQNVDLIFQALGNKLLDDN